MKIFFKSAVGNDYIKKEFNEDWADEKFQIVGDFQNSGEVKYTYSEIKELTDNYEKDILIVNSRCSASEKLEIVKLVDMQKFLYEQKKAKKDQEKKQKASQQKIKENKFHMNIAENDLKTKVDHVKKFLEENCKVKVVLELRGREVGMKDYAKEIWTNIVSNFSEYQIGERKEMNNSYFVFITK